MAIDKKKYLAIIKQLKESESYTNILTSFVETFDGSNETEFNMLMYLIVNVTVENNVNRIKAEGFDAIFKDEEEFKHKVDQLKKDFEKIGKGHMPSSPEQLSA